jgi:hypothetical protein
VLQALLVFVLAAVLDMLWVLWMRLVDVGAVGKATVASVALAAVSQYSTILNNKDNALLFPYLAGIGVGCWLAMKVNIHEDKK